MQTIFEKCPFKENGKLLKLFCLILRGLNLPVGSDTPQNKILRGISPRRTRSYVVPDPAEPSLAGYQTLQNNALRGITSPGNNVKYKYFRELETEFKNILGY
jgi:hypothetical protein